ncbi:glycoside hydrolase, partial [Acaromyces ingoldii]
GWVKRRPLVASLIALAIVAAIAVGVALGVVLGNKSDATKNGSSASPDNNAAQGSTGSNGGVASNGTSTSTNGSTTAKAVTPLPAWNLTDPNTKMIGVSLGNWLVLERWMDEDWMTSTGGDDAWDEWTFTQNLGADKAKAALTDHWNSWVTEAEIDTLKSVGINTVRIPVGYWAFVPAASGEPYVAQAGQTDQITKMLGWLYDRGMYAMIDLHGMPGSQNGDQSSGHNTTNQQWWSDTNQGYSYTVLNATIEFIKTNKYSSVVHSVCSVNEPQIYSDSNKKAIATKWYEASYNMLKAAGLIFVFHNGFGQPDDWVDFATGKDPNYIAYSTNPYPGWFPAKTNADSITSAVCTLAQQAVGYPVPMIYTEWSVVNGVQTDSFDQSYYNTQLSAYGWSAGSSFWSFKTVHSTNRVLAETNNVMDMYSLLTLISQGLVQKPSNPNESGLDMLKGLNNTGCGDIPTVKWTNPS